MASSQKKKTSAKPAKKAAHAKPAAKKRAVVAKKKPAVKLKKAAPKKAVKAPKAVSKKAVPAKAARPPINGSKARVISTGKKLTETQAILGSNHKGRKLDPFVRGQKDKLLQLRDAMVDSMAGVAKDNLRSRAEGSEASAFGMHQADAGSDAYDRDFALSLLSQEQDALYEIDQALKRIELGTYGVCEMSGKPIMHARLEAIPFARFTVECQSQLEKQNKASRVRQSVTSLFGLTDEEGGDGEEEEPKADRDDSKE
ncbi:MAG: TraR/DksA family transcriptional regulator [Chthoniobacterales bacterium]